MDEQALPAVLNSGNKLKALKQVLAWACLILLLLLANRLLVDQIPWPQTPDEIIPVRVIQHMKSSHSLDTDWAHAQELPDYFRRVHFNFSGYIMAAAAFTTVTHTQPDVVDLLSRLRMFSRLSTIALLLLVFITTRRLFGNGFALLAACAILTAPLLYQDAHYTRPEAFGTLLFTCCFALAINGHESTRKDILRLMAIAALSGFLVSIKVTYAAAILFGTPLLWRVIYKHDTDQVLWQRSAMLVVPAALLFVVGFGVGAPYALRHLHTFFDGIAVLQHQYSGMGNPPASRPEYHFFAQLGWIFSYFAAILGWLAFPLHILGYFNRDLNARQRHALYAYLAITVCTVLLFAHEHVFFERNFSHLVPAFLIISIGGLRLVATRFFSHTPRVRLLHSTVVAALFVAWQYTPVQVSARLNRTFSLNRVQADAHKYHEFVNNAVHNIGATKVISVGFYYVFRNTLPQAPTGACVLYDVTTYGDPWSQKFVADLPVSFRIAHYLPSLFANMPVSTLQVYQSPTHYLIYDSKSCHTKAG